MKKLLGFLAVLLLAGGVVGFTPPQQHGQAVSVTLTANGVQNLMVSAPNDSVTIQLAWKTSTVPDQCVATGDWDGIWKSTMGNGVSKTLRPGTYRFSITCYWPGNRSASAMATVVVDDGKPYIAPALEPRQEQGPDFNPIIRSISPANRIFCDFYRVLNQYLGGIDVPSECNW